MTVDFWDEIYLDGDCDKDDSYGKWFYDPKYVNEPPHVFVRKDLATPEPSSDLTIPKDSPYKEYLLWDESSGWYVGCWCSMNNKFYWYTQDLDGDECLEPLYWLPLPPAPDQDA